MDDETSSGSDDESFIDLAALLTEQAMDDDKSSTSGSDGESSGCYSTGYTIEFDDESEATYDESSSGSDSDIMSSAYAGAIFGSATMCSSFRRYAVLTEHDIRKEVRKQASFTAEALSVPADWALALLVHYRWLADDLIFDWDSDQDAVRHAVGLPGSGDDKDYEEEKNKETVTCGICLEAHPAAATASAGCDHRYCHACWRGYVTAAVNDGARCLALRCPAASCSRAVLRGTVKRFATGYGAAAYERSLARSYADAQGGTGTLRRCPAAGCGCAIKQVYVGAIFSVGDGEESDDVVCRCGAGFCFRCGGAPHWPATCDAAARWGARGGDADAATSAWLMVHAKPCPRCRRPVGRPDEGHGCGSVVCAPPCAHRFCWRCLCDMADPNRPRISHFDCPEVYAAAEDGQEEEAERRRERARRALDGFLRYHGMWAANMATRRNAEHELARLRAGGGGGLATKLLEDARGVIGCRGVEFLEDAWERVAEGRRVVGNVCLFARSMRGIDEEDEDGARRTRRDLLEYLLGEADDILGRLQRCVEEGPAGKDLAEFSYEVRNLTCVAKKFIGNFAKAVASGEVGEPLASSGNSATGSGTL